jgi:uncharacterized protein YbjQ (UPF0145 family)
LYLTIPLKILIIALIIATGPANAASECDKAGAVVVANILELAGSFPPHWQDKSSCRCLVDRCKMFFWKKKPTEEERQAQARQEASLKSLTAGGLPLVAQERLRAQMNSGADFFSSDLTTREYLMARQAGYQPIAQVMGCSFMNISWLGTTRRSVTGELKDLSSAHSQARQLAIQRLYQEAKLLNATGVIGVRITHRQHGEDARMVEFTAVGTAINVPTKPSVAGDEPFTSLLSGQEFWQLHQAGYWPVAVCMGVCSYYVYTDEATRKLLYSWWGGNNRNNAELPSYTQGFYQGRERALANISMDIEHQGGDGAVGMIIDQDIQSIEYEINDRTYRDFIANFSMLGTTVRRMTEAPQATRGRTLVVYDLAQKMNTNIDLDDDYDYASTMELD